MQRSAPDPAEVATDVLHVRSVLAALPSAEQEALRLTEWDQLTAAESAQVLGCTRAAFRVRLHRARRRLARLLAEVEAQPGVEFVEPGMEFVEPAEKPATASAGRCGRRRGDRRHGGRCADDRRPRLAERGGGSAGRGQPTPQQAAV